MRFVTYIVRHANAIAEWAAFDTFKSSNVWLRLDGCYSTFYKRLISILILFIGLTSVLLVELQPVKADELPTQSELPQTAFQQGVAAFQAGDYANALDQFSQAIQLDSDYTAAYGNRYLTHIQLETYEEAIADCTTVLQLQANHTEAYLNRGLAFYRVGNYDAAIADYTRLLQITPHDPRAYYNRGLAQLERRTYREAIVDFGEALRQTSPFEREAIALIHTDRGVVHLMLNQHQAAIADFTQAIHTNASNVRALFNRGCAHHRTGNMTAALADFTQVTQRDPQYAQAYLNRGLVHRQLGEPKNAIADLQQAATLFQQQQLLADHQRTLHLIKQLQTPIAMFV